MKRGWTAFVHVSFASPSTSTFSSTPPMSQNRSTQKGGLYNQRQWRWPDIVLSGAMASLPGFSNRLNRIIGAPFPFHPARCCCSRCCYCSFRPLAVTQLNWTSRLLSSRRLNGNKNENRKGNGRSRREMQLVCWALVSTNNEEPEREPTPARSGRNTLCLRGPF